MLYLIGLGLNIEGISKEGLEALKKCKRVYLENYTVDFPYSFEELQHELGKKIVSLDRESVENLKFLDEANKTDVALLVYGSPLTATTHITIIDEAKKSGIKTRVIYGASILDGIAETGLQLYKFGKIASIPKHEALSFLDLVKENEKAGTHSLLLVDIGMEFDDALKKLGGINKKIVVCSRIGNKGSRIYYGKINELEGKKIKKPYCIIIPGKMHFLEKEILEGFNN